MSFEDYVKLAKIQYDAMRAQNLFLVKIESAISVKGNSAHLEWRKQRDISIWDTN